MRALTYIALGHLAGVALGCSSGLKEFPTSKVTGRVVCDGRPVGNVRIYFEPLVQGTSAIVGKPGFAVAKDDGTFTLSTYSSGDGAVVGRHRVRVDRPHPEDFPDFQCNCQTNGERTAMEVEVTEEGDNKFEIVLPKLRPAVRKAGKAANDEDLEDIRDED